MAWNPKFQTKDEVLVRLVSRYLASSGAEACRIAYAVINLIDAGDYTPAQVAAALGISVGKWASKRATEVQPRADKHAAFLAARAALATA